MWKMLRFVAALLALMLSACATVDPNIKYYEPSPGTTSENGATIIGSRVPQSFPLDYQTAYILGISGVPIRGGKAAFAEPVVLAPGAHRVAIAWTQGSLFGSTTVQLNVKAGDQFVIKHQRVEKEVARIWLEETKTNTGIGEAIFVRISVESGGFIPIYIPRGR